MKRNIPCFKNRLSRCLAFVLTLTLLLSPFPGGSDPRAMMPLVGVPPGPVGLPGNTTHRLHLPLTLSNFNPDLYVRVPLLTGLSQGEAEAALQAAQLTLGQVTQGSSPTVPVGLVMGQHPGAGSIALPGSAVDLVISTGPAQVQVPATTDLTQALAETLITAAGLTIGTIAQENSATVPAGRVISQNPTAGTWVVEGTPVDLVVSLGPAMATVPDLVNRTQTEAETLITAAGLQVGTVTSANHPTISSGSIISQNPAAGTSVPLNTAVDLVASIGPAGPTLPPDPSLVAPPLDLTVATDIQSAARFLYTGTNPIQTGMAEGTIQFQRAAVVRGRVLDRQGQGLPWVKITVLDHAEFGQTFSRADGMFDLAVNGGGFLVIDYALEGYLGAQRQVRVPWQDYVVLPDVVLIQLDPNVTTVDLTDSGMKSARGGVVSDSDGVRQATLLFPEGLTAEIVLPDESSQLITTLNVRATEFTVGPNGPQAMPGELPPNVAYTYAVEFTVDEALALGAREVRFSQPVIHYLENFLNFPVGETVPAGYYDRTLGRWIPADSGRVIQVLETAGGSATVDTDGDGAADDLLGISVAEREQLALLYAAGQILWRVPIPHFSPYDENWALRLPADAAPPQQPLPEEKPCEECCEVQGSIVECQTQVLREEVPVAGTPFRLHYTSERALGRRAVFKIPLSGDTPPASLIRIDVEITVAGQLFNTSYVPSADLVHTFIWDGKDVYGRYVQGAQRLRVRIGYVYDAVYARTGVFSANGEPFSGPDIRTRGTTTLWQEMELPTYRLDGLGQGFGGWTLDVHHAYDAGARMVYRGDGKRQNGEALNDPNIIQTIAGNGSFGHTGDGGPAVEAELDYPQGIAAGPDGSLYIANESASVRRIAPDGTISTFAGQSGSYGFDGDGGQATEALLNWNLVDLAFGPDGSLYILDNSLNYQRIRKVDPRGIISTVAGNGLNCTFSVPYNCGNGVPALEARLGDCYGLDVGPDGSIYVAESNTHRVRRISPDGIITTLAGTGNPDFTGDGGPALTAGLANPRDVAVGRDGSLFIADTRHYVVRKVGVDGIIRTIAGIPGNRGYSGEGLSATQSKLYYPNKIFVDANDTLYIHDGPDAFPGRYPRIRRVWPAGIMDTVAGNGTVGFSGDGGPALLAQFDTYGDGGVVVGPNDALYIADESNSRVRRVAPVLPGTSLSKTRSIPSRDGAEIYQFDRYGRHLRTRHGLTGAVLFEFTYDITGLLLAVADGDGRTTTIERGSGGRPAAIVGPYGHRTVLETDSNGFISSVANPAGNLRQFAYSASGLLNQTTDGRGNIHTFSYDGNGRLVRDENPAGGFQTLERTEQAQGYTVKAKTALNRETTYRTEYLAAGQRRGLTTFSTGASTESVIGPDGSETLTLPDGTVMQTVFGPNPRFGMMAPVEKSLTVEAPSGLTYTRTLTRSADLSDPYDPLTLTGQTDLVTINGKSYSAVTDVTARRTTWSTPAGRSLVIDFDDQGRRLSYHPAGMEALTAAYDPSGRIVQVAQGTVSLAMNYDGRGRVSTRTDAAGKTTAFGYDDANRVTSLVKAGGSVLGFGYDQDGNPTSLTVPGGGIHQLEYTANNFLQSYTPPGGQPLSFIYNEDQDLFTVTLPAGRSVVRTFDASGRLSGLNYPEASVAFNYADATGRLSSTNRDPGISGLNQTITFGYDGELVISSSWTGASAGWYQYRYNNDYRLLGLTLDGGTELAWGYDNDGLLITAGPFSIQRSGPAGLPTRMTDGVLTVDYTYDTLGRPNGRNYTVGATGYTFGLTWDNRNRVLNKSETEGGASHDYQYTYDDDHQLLSVTRDSTTLVENYVYDPNGNRTQTLTSSADYDGQDRLTQLGPGTYSFNDDGQLQSRDNDTFTYSARGELIRAVIGGETVDYVYDGFGRLTARKDGAGTYRFLYGHPEKMFQLTATRSPANELTEYLYDPLDHLVGLRRGGISYYVMTDQVGSPRLVVDGAGVVKRKIEWDSYGRRLLDENPSSFDLAIGFAGGIADPLTGLVRFGFRDYDPEAGRMTSWDPLLFAGRQTNLFQYAGNNPVILADRSGEEVVTAVVVAAAVAYGIYKALEALNKTLEEDLGTKQKQLEEAAKRKDKKGLEEAYGKRNRALARCAAEAGKTAVKTVPFTPPTAAQDVIQGLAMEHMADRQFNAVTK